MATTWFVKGDAIGACNCETGCPCTFNAPPTYGRCEGAYILHFNEGRFGEVPLDGLTMSFFAHAPAALHLGNLTHGRGAGGDSYAKMGDVVECQLTPVKNPVSGAPSPFTVLLGNGFLTDRMEIYTTTKYRINHPELKFEHPEKFGETFKFHWSGQG